jgi:hypothetical protein
VLAKFTVKEKAFLHIFFFANNKQMEAYCIGERKNCKFNAKPHTIVKFLPNGNLIKIAHGQCGKCKHEAYSIVKNYKVRPYCLAEKKKCDFASTPKIIKRVLPNGNIVDIAIGTCKSCGHKVSSILQNSPLTKEPNMNPNEIN